MLMGKTETNHYKPLISIYSSGNAYLDKITKEILGGNIFTLE